ncbi:Tyrosine-protein kinase [Trema orientale]|uniref:Receptor-like serine/threonine-protein kinase n=1 Tax=Trema orientale TaxID=63057 RepID=A0A2P5D0X3_TREOI|nr:Tyrosine-protein kinase [Trema orientale]
MDAKTNPRLMPVLFLCLLFKTQISHGVDSISVNQSLSGAQTIVSAGWKFELGFFSPGKSSNYYIGMWYKNIPRQTIVWVANRETPVLDKFSSELKILDGNLVLFNESKILIWSTNVSSTSSGSVQAVLMDNGNLVLNNGSNSSEPLWQSFDNPAHTLLPGNKISYNKITRKHQILTSWKNFEDPAPGLFTLQLDNSNFILRNRSRGGDWNENTFSLIPSMPNDNYRFSFVSNENETYFTYSITDASTSISRFVMDITGQIKLQIYLPGNGWNLFWSQPRQQCQVFSFCGTYGSCNENSLPFCRCLRGFEPRSSNDWYMGDYSSGCSRRTKLQCGNNSLNNGDRDKFLEMPSMSLPDNEQSVQAGNIKECETTCFTTCSCTAYAYDNNGCSMWLGDLLNLKQLGEGDSSQRTLYIRLAASELQNNPEGSSQSRKLHILLFPIIATAIVTSGITCSVYLLRRKKVAKKQGKKRNIQGNQAITMNGSERHITDFILSDQFREDKKKDIDVPFVALESILVATDNFSEANKLGRGGFGPVYKGKFPGGLEIAIKRLSSGSGQGLQEFMNEVLLIAKLQHRNLVRLLGYCVEGDEKMLLYEYMPNKSLDKFLFEYALHGLFSIKSDVFSFGVVTLEIISGKSNTGFYQSEQALSLLDYAWELWKENKALDLMDTTLSETCNDNEFLRCFCVGLLCVQDDPSDRPTMSNAVLMLGNEAGSLPSPKQPAFVVKRSLSSKDFPTKSISKNVLTDTLNEGR